MQHIQTRLWAFFAAAAFVLPGTASASFSYDASTVNFFGAYNSYDQVNGLQQGFQNVTGYTPTVTSNPSTIGPMSSSVDINASTFEAAHGLFGDITAVGAASAYSNLALGTVGVLADSSSAQPQDALTGRANAAAMLQDYLTFTNTSGHTVNIDVYWTLDGVTTISNQIGVAFSTRFCMDAQGFCLSQGGIGSGGLGSVPNTPSQFSFVFSYNGGNANGGQATVSTPTLMPTPDSGWVSASYTSTPITPGSVQYIPGNNSIAVSFHGVYAIPNGITTEYLYGNVQLGCGGGNPTPNNCDFSHTGALSLNLNDPGVSFVSGNGLLSGVSATPEPGSLWLALAGVVCFGFRRLRGKHC